MLRFLQLPGMYAIVRLSPDADVPDWANKGEFLSVTRTPDELSVVCARQNVPQEFLSWPRWICLKLEGPFSFSQTGVLLSFIEPLSGNSIPIFAVSTYDTDYVLVPEEHAGAAFGALDEAGHERA